MTDQTDPRERYRACTITEYEFEVILEHHHRTAISQALESTALRTFSVCGHMRAWHASERLKALDPMAWKRVEEEIAQETPNWQAHANAEERRELEEALRNELMPDTEEAWTAIIACVEAQQDEARHFDRAPDSDEEWTAFVTCVEARQNATLLEGYANE